VKLFVLDTHTIYRRGLVACLDLLEDVEAVAGAESVRDAWEDPALHSADIVLLDPKLPGGKDFLTAVRETTIRLKLQRDVVAASRRAFQLSEQQLRAGTADIVTVLNTQLTLFQAEDSLSQAQLARLLAIVSLYQALGGGWEPRMERPVDAL